MKRRVKAIVRTVLGMALLAIPALGSAAFGLAGPALAEVDGARLAQAGRSANAFVALAAGSQTSGAAPRESDPMVSALFDRILDETVLSGASPTLQDAAAASKLLENGTRMLTTYMLAGTGKASLEALSEDAAAETLAEANRVAYAPEVGRLYDFTARMQGVVADALANVRAAASPDEAKAIEAGLSDLRVGIRQTVAAILDDAADDRFDTAWRKRRITVLGDVGPKIARLLAEGDLASLRATATAMAGRASDPSVRSELQRLALVLAPR